MDLPKIESRKVHGWGNGGLAVLIPAEWARDKGIKKGSEVLVLADDRVVIEKPTDERVQEIQQRVDNIIEEENKIVGGKK